MGDPVPVARLAEVLGMSEVEVRILLGKMEEAYEREDRGIHLIEINDGYQLCTKKEAYEALISMTAAPKRAVLTEVQMEILAIIAYRQPVTRLEVEKIRGVKNDSAFARLLELELIEEAGRKDAPGRPILFVTSERFLRKFGISSIDELPVPDVGDTADLHDQAQDEIELQVEV